MKYTIRELGFLVFLALLIASPLIKMEYDKRTTTDPFILMAREIEDFLSGEVDVITVEEDQNLPNTLTVIVFIEEYPKWSQTAVENFKRYVLQVTREHDYDSLLIVYGWNYSAKKYRVQGTHLCLELKTKSCVWQSVIPGVPIETDFIKWPGIGNP